MSAPATPAPTTYTTRTISFDAMLDSFVKCRHPKNTTMQNISKYNTLAMIANAAIVTTVAAVALACFTSYAVLGILLAAGAGATYWFIGAEKLDEQMKHIKPLLPKEWQPALLHIEGLPIAIFRCAPSPEEKAPTPPVEGQAAAPAEVEGKREFPESEGKTRLED